MGNMPTCSYCTKRASKRVTVAGSEKHEPGTNFWFFHDKQIIVLRDMVGEPRSSEVGLFTTHEGRILMHLDMCAACLEARRSMLPQGIVTTDLKACFFGPSK